MKPTRAISRRSFLLSVGGAAVGGGALVAVTGRAGAMQSGEHDSGARADPVGQRRSGAKEPGDADFVYPRLMGDVMESDPAPGRMTGANDSDSGPAFDHVGYGVGAGRARREGHAARCAATRQRIARLEAVSPPTTDGTRGLANLRTYLGRWSCN